MAGPQDCGDVASPWPGVILEVKQRDGVFRRADGVFIVITDGRLVRIKVVP